MVYQEEEEEEDNKETLNNEEETTISTQLLLRNKVMKGRAKTIESNRKPICGGENISD